MSRRDQFLLCGIFYFFKAFTRSAIIAFSWAVNETQLEKNSICSLDSSTILPSEKNWLSDIPKPLHTSYRVEIEGVVFRLNRFAIVDCERPDSFASLYSVQFRSSSNCWIRRFTSTTITTLTTILVLTWMA